MIRGMIRGYDSEILNCPSAHIFAYMNLCKTSLNLLEKRSAAVKAFCALWRPHAVGAARAAVRVVCAVCSGHAGAVPLECRCKVLVQGVACCHSATCSSEWACSCRCKALLQVLPEGAAALNNALERAWW